MNTSVIRSFLVGVLVLVAAILAIWTYSFFNQRLRADRTYGLTLLFDDAQGIGKQADVYLAGVNVGSVASVGLSPTTGKAEVRVQLLKGARIPNGSVATISASLLGGTASVEFTPPPQSGPLPPNAYYRPGSVISGRESVSLATIQAQAGGLMGQFSTTANKANALLDQATKTAAMLNQIVSDPRLRGSLTQTVQNLDEASEQGLRLTADLRTMMAQDNGQVRTALGNVTATTGSIRDTALQSKERLSQIVDNLNQTTQQLDQLTTQANRTLTTGSTLQNLSDTVANLKAATIKMNSIEANISSLTSDKQVQSDLRTTIHAAAQASQNTSILVARLTALTGASKSNAARGNLQFVSRLDFTQDFRTNKFRTDFDLLAPLSGSEFARFGVYDLTGLNELNLQYGQTSPYNKLLTYRAGIYASQVGIGVDYDLFGPRTFSLDLYDPNRIRIDARQKFRLNNESSLWLGLQDVPRTNAVTLGFELQH